MINILIFAKYPQAGKAKTRLAEGIGLKKSAEIAEKLLTQTLVEVAELIAKQQDNQVIATVCVSPAPTDALWQDYQQALYAKFPHTKQLQWQAQSQGDLGDRLIRASVLANVANQQQGLKNPSLIYIGTDCPALTHQKLAETIQQLTDKDGLIIPAEDGGYVLLAIKGFSEQARCLFTDMAWSTDTVAQTTIQRMRQLNWDIDILATEVDIDYAKDMEKYDINALSSVYK